MSDAQAREQAVAPQAIEPDDRPVQFEQLGRVVVATINRPRALNALNADVMTQLVDRFSELDVDPDVGCFVLTGSDRAFAAGADIKELQEQSYRSMMADNYFSRWDDFAALRTPKIAAVGGYALGGGCELAMMCDFVIAADSARFGQPEIKLGLMPGMGGTQRLTRLIGRSKAMDMILTGRMMDAEEAERSGLVSRVVPAEALRATALDAAETIAGYAKPIAMVAAETVDRADEVSLTEGVRTERRSYYALFDTAEAIEGMAAFSEKREPRFRP
jgi:enoyl-CoA hydratase